MKKALLLFSLLISLVSPGQTWTPVSLETGKDLNDVHFLNTDHGWIVGDSGEVQRYYSETWHEMASGIDTALNAVFMVDTNDVWMAGAGGNILHYTSSGFQQVASPTSKTLNDIYMLNGQKGWIAGEDGTLLVYDGVSWQNDTIVPSVIFPNHLEYDDLLQIDFYTDDFGIIVGEWGTYLEYRNGIWTDTSSINTQSFTSVEILDTNIIAVGGFEANPLINSCFIFIYNGGGIFLYFSVGWPNGYGHITSMKVIDNKGWAILTDGNVLKYNGNEFLPFENFSLSLNSLSLVNPINGWIVGDSGTLLHFDPRPHIDLGEDLTFCEGDTVKLTPGPGFISYLWNTGEENDSITVTQPGIFWVEVVNEYGFPDRDTIIVSTLPKPGIPQIISGPSSVDILVNTESTFTASETANADQYEWVLIPVEAGTISGTGSNSTVTWSSGYIGTAELSVRGMNSNCTGDFSSGHPVTVYSSQGLDDWNDLEDIKAIPNPTTGIFRINGENIVSVQIIDRYGKVLIKENKTNFDLSNYPDGIYLIITTTNKGVMTRKIIKKS